MRQKQAHNLANLGKWAARGKEKAKQAISDAKERLFGHGSRTATSPILRAHLSPRNQRVRCPSNASMILEDDFDLPTPPFTSCPSSSAASPRHSIEYQSPFDDNELEFTPPEYLVFSDTVPAHKQSSAELVQTSDPDLTPALIGEDHEELESVNILNEEHEPFELEDEEDEAENYAAHIWKGRYIFAPSAEAIKEAVSNLDELLSPRRKTRYGHLECKLDDKVRIRLTNMRTFAMSYLWQLERDPDGNHWMAASLHTAKTTGKVSSTGIAAARNLRRWLRNYIVDRDDLPTPHFKGGLGRSLIDDEDLCQEIHLHLQSIGKYVKAMDIVHYLDTPEMLARLNHTKTISLATAQNWMKKIGYRWTLNPVGQYADGHARPDIVRYRTDVFLPKMGALEPRMRKWVKDAGFVEDTTNLPSPSRPVVFWYQDESTFYAHDRRKVRWVHKSETATPYAKGEGHSLMVADFVSADYGWLSSPDGSELARVLFRAGKARDGYFDNKDICSQADNAMDILRRHYPDEDHVIVYDNATTHTKREEGALSALKMTKGPSANFGVEVNVIGIDDKPVYAPNGKFLKQKARMGNGYFNGSEQPFYWPADHPVLANQFKGMSQILTERGKNVIGKKAQCGKAFKDCTPGSVDCCCRRMLFNEPDFVNVKSILEAEAEANGFQVIFLPKFHCELNFIEQCWGFAKRRYRLNAPSSKEDDLERNVVAALEEVPLLSMRRFATRSLRFMDAYRRGLNDRQAAWAAKKYKSHRVVPDGIMDELVKAQIA